MIGNAFWPGTRAIGVLVSCRPQRARVNLWPARARRVCSRQDLVGKSDVEVREASSVGARPSVHMSDGLTSMPKDESEPAQFWEGPRALLRCGPLAARAPEV